MKFAFGARYSPFVRNHYHVPTASRGLVYHRLNIPSWKRQTAIFVQRPDARQTYEELARSYGRSLQREETQLALTTPPVIQLIETVEGLCLLAALTLQLIPAVIVIRQYSATSTANATSPAVEQRQTKENITEAVTPVRSERLRLESSGGYSLWSAVLLVVGVILGSVLRRFRSHQLYARQNLLPMTSAPLHGLDREELENSVSRAFAEISHLASQVEKLRIKVRLISQEYGTAMRESNIQSNQLKRTVEEVVAELKGAESRIQDLSVIVGKLQGFAGRQFEVVSSALRRIDKECKALSSQLPPPADGSDTEVVMESAVLSEVKDLAT